MKKKPWMKGLSPEVIRWAKKKAVEANTALGRPRPNAQTPERRAKTGALTKRYSRSTKGVEGPCCDICGFSTAGGKLARDHNHTSGKRRGNLCAQCNQGLGLFLDNDPELLEKAAAYLRKHQGADV